MFWDTPCNRAAESVVAAHTRFTESAEEPQSGPTSAG
jgi:hypothetical protein